MRGFEQAAWSPYNWIDICLLPGPGLLGGGQRRGGQVLLRDPLRAGQVRHRLSGAVVPSVSVGLFSSIVRWRERKLLEGQVGLSLSSLGAVTGLPDCLMIIQ